MEELYDCNFTFHCTYPISILLWEIAFYYSGWTYPDRGKFGFDNSSASFAVNLKDKF